MRFFIKRKFLIVFIIIQHYISSFGWYLPAAGQWLEVCCTLGGCSFTPENLGINVDQYFFIDKSIDAVNMINQYLALCTNHDDLMSHNNTGIYWQSLERDAGRGMYTSFGWTDGSNNTLHFIATYDGYKSYTKKVRPFIAF